MVASLIHIEINQLFFLISNCMICLDLNPTDGEVVLCDYEPTAAGIVQSFVERFTGSDFELIVRALWDKDRAQFY